MSKKWHRFIGMVNTIIHPLGYEHGREWLAKKVSSLIAGDGENDKNKVRVEKELLLVIDNLYR